jgi:hypothetical protein
MGQGDLVTNTSQWTLVIQRVSQDQATVWVGTLFPFMKMPRHARVVLTDDAGNEKIHAVQQADWRRPFRHVSQRFYTLATFVGLTPGRHYRVRFERRVEVQAGVRDEPLWQLLREGELTTLPDALPGVGALPFTVALGSCFYNHRDGGQVAASYKALYERGGDVSPDITILTGDQVYLDIGFDSLSLIPREIRERIASDYALHWQALGSMLCRGGTWMLPDDHEYWNDFPFYDSPVPTLLALKLAPVRRAWTAAARDAVQNIQGARQLEMFAIGNELSFCLADLRSYRSNARFLPEPAFKQLCDWAASLTCPGVLVLPQPLIVGEDGFERNLRSFPDQYTRLLKALGNSGHDIVVLSGDVHFGRIASVPLGTRGGRLLEIISSPMSNLTGLNGIATAAPKLEPIRFPDGGSAGRLGWPTAPVEYRQGRWAVSTKPGFLLSAYPKARTREHFMTIGFSRDGLGGVRLEANAWRVREREGEANLPVRDFSEPYRVTLR